MRTLRLVMLSVVFGSGCIAIKSTVHVSQAEQALAKAGDYNAQEAAPYEYTMAVRYLEKSREEIGWADYRMSEDLAKRSIEWSDKAIITIERGNRGIDFLRDAPDLLTDEVVPAPEMPVVEDPGDDWLDVDGPVTPVEEAPAPAPEPVPDEPVPGDEFSEDEDEFEWEE